MGLEPAPMSNLPILTSILDCPFFVHMITLIFLSNAVHGAGVTVVTHGWQSSGPSGGPHWLRPMADALAANVVKVVGARATLHRRTRTWWAVFMLGALLHLSELLRAVPTET